MSGVTSTTENRRYLHDPTLTRRRVCYCYDRVLYGLEVCPVNVSDMRSLEFTLKRIMIKLFCTYDSGIINTCMSFFGLPTVSGLVDQRKNWVYIEM